MTILKPPLHTCESVISEPCFRLQQASLDVTGIFEMIERKVLVISFELKMEFLRVAALMKKYANLPIDLADAFLVAMAEKVSTARVLTPMTENLNASTIRNHLHQVANRAEKEMGSEQFCFIEGCQRDWGNLPRPDLPITVGLDSGYVHSSEKKSRADGWFEVIAGKSVTADGASQCFALVNGHDDRPKRRLFEVLKSQGMQMNQQITFLETIEDLGGFTE